jgi:sortase A
MPIDKKMPDTSSQVTLSARHRLWHWLSTGLIAVGLLLLVAGGVMAYRNWATLSAPPSPVGQADLLPSKDQAESTPPPSLEDNPLPVFTGDTLVGATAPYAVPTPTFVPTSIGPTPARTPDSIEKAPEEDADVSPDPLPSPTSTLVPVATHPPSRIVAPAINLDSEVVPVGWKQVTQDGGNVSVWEVAEYAAGWHQNSKLPGGGGNIVLSGHHNIKGEVFRYLVDLVPGDTVTLYADDRPYTYTVEARLVVRDKGVPEAERRENARWIGPFPDERVTLITCWPYTNNTHRVIVIAKPSG